jgi:predicted PurR-regulated permease PerM
VLSAALVAARVVGALVVVVVVVALVGAFVVVVVVGALVVVVVVGALVVGALVVVVGALVVVVGALVVPVGMEEVATTPATGMYPFSMFTMLTPRWILNVPLLPHPVPQELTPIQKSLPLAVSVPQPTKYTE